MRVLKILKYLVDKCNIFSINLKYYTLFGNDMGKVTSKKLSRHNSTIQTNLNGKERRGEGGGGVKVDEYKTNNLYFSPSSGVIVITYSFMTHTMVWSV